MRKVSWEKDDISLKVSVQRCLSAKKSDPSDEFIVSIRGDLIYQPEGAEEKYIGRIFASIVLLESALDARRSVFELFDSSAELLQYYELLLNHRTCRWKVGGKGVGRDALFINSVEIDEAFRGQFLGYCAVARVVETFGPRDGLTFLTPSPVSEVADDYEAAEKKLTSYWSAAGFESALNTGLLFIENSNGIPADMLEALDKTGSEEDY